MNLFLLDQSPFVSFRFVSFPFVSFPFLSFRFFFLASICFFFPTVPLCLLLVSFNTWCRYRCYCSCYTWILGLFLMMMMMRPILREDTLHPSHTQAHTHTERDTSRHGSKKPRAGTEV
ncbi:hypothetical protein M0812_08909 [Anaeramoeba flamelloides]|uniref:Uncharacterized protein n=1 Tax=Anaeramoeba flamelloides TaxID=1746091 RepID=A0AAV7ZWI5_9EUKA|nr:hypothetical protein M0812_08909 [Anaeramoeba flamelloides]